MDRSEINGQPASEPGPYRRGIHLMVQTDTDAVALAEAVPQLAGMGTTDLIVEVNYGYAYESHPELRTQNPVSQESARSLARVCREHCIRLIPQFQCLGHQSWSENTFPLRLALRAARGISVDSLLPR